MTESMSQFLRDTNLNDLIAFGAVLHYDAGIKAKFVNNPMVTDLEEWVQHMLCDK